MSEDENVRRRVEESEAIESMFGESCEVHADALADLTNHSDVALPIMVKVQSESNEDVVHCDFILPVGYPGQVACTVSLRSDSIPRRFLTDLSTQLQKIAEEHRSEGAEAVFDIISAVQERLSIGFEDESPKVEEAPKCRARHILMKTEAELMKVKDRLEKGEDFAIVARQSSTCSSKIKGGSLGIFSPGEMAPEFDQVCFSPNAVIGEVVGPVQTKFGYHLIVVLPLEEEAVTNASGAGGLTCLEATADGLRLTVEVKPGQSCTEVLNVSELRQGTADAIRLAIAAPPREGEANVELTKFLAKVLGVPKASVVIMTGQHSHSKGIAVSGEGLEPGKALEQLLSH